MPETSLCLFRPHPQIAPDVRAHSLSWTDQDIGHFFGARDFTVSSDSTDLVNIKTASPWYSKCVHSAQER